MAEGSGELDWVASMWTDGEAPIPLLGAGDAERSGGPTAGERRQADDCVGGRAGVCGAFSG